MTPKVTWQTVDGTSIPKIERITTAMGHERYRSTPCDGHIPTKNGKTLPLGTPTPVGTRAGEVVRSLGAGVQQADVLRPV